MNTPTVIPWGQMHTQMDNIYSIFRDKLSLPDGSLYCSPCHVVSFEFAIHGCINASFAINIFNGFFLNRHLMKSLALLLLLD